MIWQDLLITSSTIIFSVSLIPQVYYGFKEKTGPIKFLTSVPTFIGLYAVAGAYFSLGLVFSTVFTTITATMWLLLCAQRMLYEKKNP